MLKIDELSPVGVVGLDLPDHSETLSKLENVKGEATVGAASPFANNEVWQTSASDVGSDGNSRIVRKVTSNSKIFAHERIDNATTL